MTPERWLRITEVLDAAWQREPGERSAFLDQACADDPELRDKVEALLASDEKSGDFLKTPAAPAGLARAIQLLPEHSSEAPNLIGTRIGRYSITGLIGKGGMGAVYRAVREDDFRMQVAIKLLKRGTDTEAALGRFRAERQILAGLQHPNIARLLDGGATESGLPYFVMEYVDGTTLLEHGAALPVRQRLELFRQVCTAVQFAHEKQIVHRDIKPANLLVTPEGIPKLLDFGIAKLLDPAGDGSTMALTALGARLMTPGYASPEQVRGEAVTTASDIFSLGAVLYELLTGRRAHPVETCSAEAIEKEICARVPEKPSTVAADVDADLDNIVLMALRKEPERRYASVEEFSADLDRFLHNLPVHARKDSLLYRGGKFLRRNRVPAITAAVSTVMVLALVMGLDRFVGSGSAAFIRTPAARTWETAGTVRPLAVGAGNEIMPTFSPDGARVAYVWDGGGDEDGEYTNDLYVKQVDSDKVARLTADARLEWFPQWSPDGRHIAFYRNPEVLVIPAIGGPEIKLGEAKWGGINPLQTWAGDGAGVITSDTDSMRMQSALWFLPLDQSPKVRITDPPPRTVDLTPAMSPDGRTLAFTRNSASFANNIFLLPMDGHRPAGPPRQLTFNVATTYFYLTWAQDGRSLFCLRARPDPAVVRIPLGENHPPVPVPQIFPAVLNFLATSLVGNRLAWSTAIYDLDLWRTEIPRTGQASHPVTIARTMRSEQEPAISPDGTSTAFMSDRGGVCQLWLSDSDGGNLKMIDARKSHYPNWSPDGKEIAYEVFDEDNIDIYIRPGRGGESRRITSGTWQAQRPVWSRDGRWIYFSSDSSGVREIWKVPAGGGPMVRVTHDGGFRAMESADGKTIYFTRQSQETSLWAMPISGGRAEKLLDSLPSGDAFQVFEDGVYSVMRPALKMRPELVFYSFDTARLQKVCDVDARFERQISISADRRWLLYDTWRHRAGDLMMLEGYH